MCERRIKHVFNESCGLCSGQHTEVHGAFVVVKYKFSTIFPLTTKRFKLVNTANVYIKIFRVDFSFVWSFKFLTVIIMQWKEVLNVEIAIYRSNWITIYKLNGNVLGSIGANIGRYEFHNWNTQVDIDPFCAVVVVVAGGSGVFMLSSINILCFSHSMFERRKTFSVTDSSVLIGIVTQDITMNSYVVMCT